jgi:hypothetical protein
MSSPLLVDIELVQTFSLGTISSSLPNLHPKLIPNLPASRHGTGGFLQRNCVSVESTSTLNGTHDAGR